MITRFADKRYRWTPPQPVRQGSGGLQIQAKSEQGSNRKLFRALVEYDTGKISQIAQVTGIGTGGWTTVISDSNSREAVTCVVFHLSDRRMRLRVTADGVELWDLSMNDIEKDFKLKSSGGDDD